MKLAIFGGSFNPVHNGHLALTDAVHAAFGYDRILLVPANLPPHKEMAGGASVADRLAMLEAAIAGSAFLEIEDCELRRGGVSYTIDTLRYLEEKYSGRLSGKIGLIIGQDLAAGFSTWREAGLIAEKADIIVAVRPIADKSTSSDSSPVRNASPSRNAGVATFAGDESPSRPFPYPCVRLENPPVAVSSSEIRSLIGAAKSCRSLVPEPVYRYIVEHHLYE